MMQAYLCPWLLRSMSCTVTALLPEMLTAMPRK
jgi:hypothetical protein